MAYAPDYRYDTDRGAWYRMASDGDGGAYAAWLAPGETPPTVPDPGSDAALEAAYRGISAAWAQAWDAARAAGAGVRDLVDRVAAYMGRTGASGADLGWWGEQETRRVLGLSYDPAQARAQQNAIADRDAANKAPQGGILGFLDKYAGPIAAALLTGGVAATGTGAIGTAQAATLTASATDTGALTLAGGGETAGAVGGGALAGGADLAAGAGVSVGALDVARTGLSVLTQAAGVNQALRAASIPRQATMPAMSPVVPYGTTTPGALVIDGTRGPEQYAPGIAASGGGSSYNGAALAVGAVVIAAAMAASTKRKK